MRRRRAMCGTTACCTVCLILPTMHSSILGLRMNIICAAIDAGSSIPHLRMYRFISSLFDSFGFPHFHRDRHKYYQQILLYDCEQEYFRDMTEMIEGLHSNMDSNHGMKKELFEMKLRMAENIEKISDMKKVGHSLSMIHNEKSSLRLLSLILRIIKWTKVQHFLRSAYNNQERDWIINSLGEGEALVTLDFAQKASKHSIVLRAHISSKLSSNQFITLIPLQALPMWKWEDQKKYYGKRG